MEWGIPSATEGRHLDDSIFGDQYSNFNAGKILLIIEGRVIYDRVQNRKNYFEISALLPIE